MFTYVHESVLKSKKKSRNCTCVYAIHLCKHLVINVGTKVHLIAIH